MLHTREAGFEFMATNQATPSNAPGTTVTPGNNTFGSYVSILAPAALTEDCYGLWIHLGNNSTSAAIRDMLWNVGIDRTGGTTYTTLIPNLVCAGAGTAAAQPGVVYYFPIFIPSGSQLAAQSSVNNATAGAPKMWVRAFGKPSRAELPRYGHFVRSFGEVAASSRGTLVVPGNSGAEGSWTQLGSATGDDLWWWQIGMGLADTTATQQAYFADLSVGTTTEKRLVIQDEMWMETTAEVQAQVHGWNYYHEVPSGANVYGRASAQSTSDADFSMVAYGVGG